MAVLSSPSSAPDERAAERALRAEARAAVERLLADRERLGPAPDDGGRIRAAVREIVADYQRGRANANQELLSDPEGLAKRIADGLLGLGVLQPLMDDPAVEEVLCNGPHRVFAIRDGRKQLEQDVYFEDEDELLGLVKRMLAPAGRRVDASSPMVDVRLPDGSRLNAAIPPATTRTCVTIRKFTVRARRLEQLVELGTLSAPAARFLDAAVRAGVSILVSGPTGSGKTTLLNGLGACIASPDERVVTVEETAELQLERQLPDCVALQARAGNAEGAGEIRVRELVRNALRMRPTRIVVGEVRGAEALDMLQAMNTGHEGSLSTIHGNSPRDALDRLATLAMMAEERLPVEALTKMIARAVGLVVQLRLEPLRGRRRVDSVYEVVGLEGNTVTGQELWRWDPATDALVWTGIRPRCLAAMAARGVAYEPPPVTEAAA